MLELNAPALLQNAYKTKFKNMYNVFLFDFVEHNNRKQTSYIS